MILITTAGRCAVVTPQGKRKICTEGEIVLGTPECEAFLIKRGAAKTADAKDYSQLMEETEEANSKVPAYEKMTISQLKEVLTEKGIAYPDKVKKDELVALLLESEGA